MLLSKKYIFGHFLVIIIAVLCCVASVWQFSRLADRKELNSKIESRTNRREVSLLEILNADSTSEDVEKNEYRKVSLEGTYEEQGEVLISGRFVDGEPGYNVVTPLVLSNSKGVVFINRGWIKLTLGDAISAGEADKDEIIPVGGYNQVREVIGLVRKNEVKQLLNSNQNVQKNDAVSTRISTDIFQELLGSKSRKIIPLWIQLEFQKIDGEKITENAGIEKTYPIAVAAPELTEKNHFSYAIQWLMFAIVAVATWSVICFKVVKTGGKK